MIRQKWSPHQVDKWLKGHPEVGFTVSRETIYQYVKEDREKDGDLYLSLRRVGKPYRHGRFKEYRGKIKDRVDITQRPDIVNKRLRIGDWEVDSVIGCMNQSSIVTLVERLSRYTTIIKVNSKEAVGVAEAIVNRCKANNLPVKTITGDNGLEFAEHVYIAKELGIDCKRPVRECSSNCVILKIISQISVYLENKYPAEKLPKPNLISAYSI